VWGSWLVVVDAIVAVGVVVGSLAVDVSATGVVLVAGGAVVAGWVDVEGALVLVVFGLLLPGEELPPNGSVYCWSPAEPPPEASVTAGTANARAASSSKQVTSQRGVRTHASMATVLAPRTRAPQTDVLQDLLQNQEVYRRTRRSVLGWLPPYPQPSYIRRRGRHAP
jgi:hypothetical protein